MLFEVYLFYFVLERILSGLKIYKLYRVIWDKNVESKK